MDDMQSEMSIDEYGDKRWVVNGKIHRLDGPAVEYRNGDKEWWVNDKRHREDGPAVEWANGDTEWWYHDEIHRTDGPAIQWHYGAIEWCLHGYCYTFEEWLKANTEISDEEKVMLKLQYG